MANMNYSSRSPLMGILIFVAVIMGIYFVTKTIFSVLLFISPILLIITAIMDFSVINDFGKYLFKLVKTNFPVALGAIVVAYFFPLGVAAAVSTFLFGKVMLKRKLSKFTEKMGMGGENAQNPFFNEEKKEAEFTDFEEVEEDVLKIDQAPKEKQTNGDYDKFF